MLQANTARRVRRGETATGSEDMIRGPDRCKTRQLSHARATLTRQCVPGARVWAEHAVRWGPRNDCLLGNRLQRDGHCRLVSQSNTAVGFLLPCWLSYIYRASAAEELEQQRCTWSLKAVT